MYEQITPSVLATEAVMTLAAFDGVVVFVEGPTDMTIFEDFLPRDRFRVIHGVNKDIALGALAVIDSFDDIGQDRKRRVLAIVDADFDRPLNIIGHPRAFLTDHHDLEMMMIWSTGFDRLLRQYGSDEKLVRFGGVDAVRVKLLEVGKFLGAMRLFAKKSQIALDFKNVKYETYLEKRTLNVNRLGLCQGMYGANRSVLNEMTVAEFVTAVEAELTTYQGDERDLVQGHDLLNLFGLMMRFVLSSMDASASEEENIAPALRLSYRPEDWLYSVMAQSLQKYLREHGLPGIVRA
jgi:hypothetical protein